MDYTAAPRMFRIRKAMRCASLYGLQRAIAKVRGQFHMGRRFPTLPKNQLWPESTAHVALIARGNFGSSVIAYYLYKNYGQVIRGCMDTEANRAASLFKHFKACC